MSAPKQQEILISRMLIRVTCRFPNFYQCEAWNFKCTLTSAPRKSILKKSCSYVVLVGSSRWREWCDCEELITWILKHMFCAVAHVFSYREYGELFHIPLHISQQYMWSFSFLLIMGKTVECNEWHKAKLGGAASGMPSSFLWAFLLHWASSVPLGTVWGNVVSSRSCPALEHNTPFPSPCTQPTSLIRQLLNNS